MKILNLVQLQCLLVKLKNLFKVLDDFKICEMFGMCYNESVVGFKK